MNKHYLCYVLIFLYKQLGEVSEDSGDEVSHLVSPIFLVNIRSQDVLGEMEGQVACKFHVYDSGTFANIHVSETKFSCCLHKVSLPKIFWKIALMI